MGNLKGDIFEVEPTADGWRQFDYAPKWYEGERHFNEHVRMGPNGLYLSIEVLPAGWVYLVKRFIERDKMYLRYTKHSKRKAKLIKRIKLAEATLAVMIERRISPNEALKVLEG